MTIAAAILADSISPAGVRLTTFQLRYPRMIHSEFMTHRLFSRNASSSRAIPVAKMIADLRQDPAMPVFWGSNKPGMQAGEELTGVDLDLAQSAWLMGMEDAIAWVEKMVAAGLHKQIANRMLEPWAHINVVCTATDWANFYELRRHKDAQPEMRALAEAMYVEHEKSIPRLLQPGEWHLPYIDDHDHDEVGDLLVPEAHDRLIKVSVARCARVSYLTFEGKTSTFEEDLQLYERLLGAQPLHASPAEHQATPDTQSSVELIYAGHGNVLENPSQDFDNPHQHGNLRGWRQYRKMLPGEFIPG
jgi:hypothetical protein